MLKREPGRKDMDGSVIAVRNIGVEMRADLTVEELEAVCKSGFDGENDGVMNTTLATHYAASRSSSSSSSSSSISISHFGAHNITPSVLSWMDLNTSSARRAERRYDEPGYV